MKFKLLFAWYDFWVGLFYDQKKNWLYILPIPMIGLIVKLPQRRYWIIDDCTREVIGSTCSDDLDHVKKTNHKVLFTPYWARAGSTIPLFGPDLLED